MLADKLTGEEIGPLAGWQQCVPPKGSVDDVLTELIAPQSNLIYSPHFCAGCSSVRVEELSTQLLSKN